MIAIITEANSKVATGHFAEAKTLASALSDRKQEVKILVNSDVPKSLLSDISVHYEFYNDIFDCVERLHNVPVIVTDLRNVQNSFVKKLKDKNGFIVCIDELGNKELDADIVINNLIDPSYHRYTLKRGTKLYGGPDYMIMKTQFSDLAKKERVISPSVQRIAICMGGADIPNVTMKIVNALNNFDGEIDVIVGGGYMYHGELEKAVSTKSNINLYSNISNVYDVLYHVDIAFCSGGNVLYELACLGVPALTIYTNTHEKDNAKCFAKNGFGILIGQAESIDDGEIIAGYTKLKDITSRENQSKCGKQAVDGLAVQRIIDILVDKTRTAVL